MSEPLTVKMKKKNIKILDMYQLFFTELDNNVFYFYYGLT